MLRWVAARDPSLPNGAEKLSEYQAIATDPEFTGLPPIMRLYTLSSISEMLTILGQFDRARVFAEQALLLNNNLDKPWDAAWTSFRKAQIGRPWLRLGEAYMGLGDRESAVVAFRRAISIEPQHGDADKARFRLRELGVNP
jgi:tetratricopeptide (TPR) repeat protein